ncbi:MAG: hypothetical protein ACO3LT_08475 [Ilumatobacteraceae bacterium]
MDTTTTTTAARVAGVRIERFAGARNGWRAASPAVLDAATAARRLRLYRAVRGHQYMFRVSAPVLPVLPARRNATPWHARTVPFSAVYALFAVTFAVGAVLTVRDAVRYAPASGVVTYAVRAR